MHRPTTNPEAQHFGKPKEGNIPITITDLTKCGFLMNPGSIPVPFVIGDLNYPPPTKSIFFGCSKISKYLKYNKDR